MRGLDLVAGEPTAEWCDGCNFSMTVVPLISISENGVGQVGTYRECIHCNPDEDGVL